MLAIEAGLVIIGIINGAKLAESADKRSFIYFCIAMVLGLLFGYFHLFGLAGIEEGIKVALESSGLYKLVKIA